MSSCVLTSWVTTSCVTIPFSSVCSAWETAANTFSFETCGVDADGLGTEIASGRVSIFELRLTREESEFVCKKKSEDMNMRKCSPKISAVQVQRFQGK